MHHRLPLCFLLAAAGAVAACHNVPLEEARTPAAVTGDYDFILRYGSAAFEGVMQVRVDTILVAAKDGACKPVTTPSSAFTIVVSCGGFGVVDDFGITINRRDPEHLSTWRGTTLRPGNRRECDRWTTDANGQRVCTSEHTVLEDVKVSVGGPIKLLVRTPVQKR